ncbi:MAG: flagellar basal body-associated FliL family protein [Thermodesulfobacteria bacterium]|nr:flagellar basal body-associated FliL family protein [Thermodesulfobacteriota bacterium]
MADEEKAQEKEGGKKGGKKKLILFLLIGILIIAIAGVGVMFLTGGKKKAKGEEGGGGEPAPTEEVKNFDLYTMDPIVVNLFDPTGRRYMQIQLALALPDKKYEDEIKKMEPVLKDTIITYLSAMTPEEALQPQAKEQIKEELLKKLNQALGKHIIMAVYITQYIVE